MTVRLLHSPSIKRWPGVLVFDGDRLPLCDTELVYLMLERNMTVTSNNVLYITCLERKLLSVALFTACEAEVYFEKRM